MAYINNFEKTAAAIAIYNNYDFVICGHIHQPEIKTIETNLGSVTYLNSGDWVENLSSLEYNEGHWNLYEFELDTTLNTQTSEPFEEPDNSQLFQGMLKEFNLMKNI